MEIIKTPLWILEQVEETDLKLGMVIVELPNHETLRFLDENGHFQPAVLNQILQILMTLRGYTPAEVVMSATLMDQFPEFPVDEDLMFLQFQKHYFNTTQTVCLPFNENGETQAARFSDNLVTNKYFKAAKFILKYTMNVVLEPNRITFTVDGLGSRTIEADEVSTVKSIIL